MSEEKKEPEEAHTGLHFSWRFSLFGLGLILFLLALMAYRHITLGVPIGFSEDATIEVVPDSLLQPKSGTQE